MRKMVQTHQALLIAIGCLLLFAAAKAGYCPDGWTVLSYDAQQEECYHYFGRELNWEDAERACMEAGGQNATLVTLRSADENNVVYDLWASYQNETKKPGFWIGLQRRINSDGWSWWKASDGKQGPYKNWNPDQPTAYVPEDEGANTKDCVELSIVGTTAEQQQKWTTRRCNKLRPYMCNRPVL